MCILSLILKRYLKMTVFHENGVINKAWYLLRTYILTLRRFDLFLQGAFLIIILLETNVYLLLRRDHNGGQTPAHIENWIIVSNGGTEFIFGAAISWWGGRKRNFALAAWLLLAAVSGLMVLLFPFADDKSPFVELCDGTPITKYTEEGEGWDAVFISRMVFLLVTAAFCTLTKVSIWAHGFTYLDDHDPQNGPYFYGILISIRLSLGLSGHNWLQPSSLGEDWWKSHLSISCLTLMFAILFTLFPVQMKVFPEDEVETTPSTNYFPSLERIARNKALVLQTLALAMLTAAVFGFVHYDRDYVQGRFHVEAYRQDPQTSRGVSDIFRSLVIIFFVMVFRVRFSGPRSNGVKANTASKVGGVLAAIVAVFLAVIAALSCNLSTIDGVEDNYVQPSCSKQCGCDSARYGFSPVCGLDTSTTYFSPCHAGCQEYEDLNGFLLFQNCSCGEQRMVRGACSLGECRVAFGAYQVLYSVFLAISAAAFVMQGMVIVRAVERVDKPLAVGASLSAVAVLAFVGGHITYMIISYFTCIYHDDGRCVLHSTNVWILCCISSLLALGSGAVSILASRARTKPAVPTTEL